MKKIMTAALAAGLVFCAMASPQARELAPAFKIPSLATPVFFEKFFGGGQAGGKKQQAATYYINDEQAFQQNTHISHLRPYNNPSLEFDISVPKNWTLEDTTKSQSAPGAVPIPGQQAIGQNVIGDIASLHSEMIDINRLNVSVSVESLDLDISAKNWLKNFILKNGYALQDEVKEKDAHRASAYYTSIADAKNIFTYITVQETGNLMLIARFDTPLPLKDFASFIQKRLLDSIKVTYPQETEIEESKVFSLVDAVKFSYPVSWQILNPDFKDMSRLMVMLQTRDATGIVSGFIRILAVRRSGATSLQKEIATLKTHLSDNMDINVRNVNSSSTHEAADRFLFKRFESYDASYKKEGHNDPDLRVVVLGDKQWYILAYMISPREQDSLTDWAHSTRSFDLITKSFK